jgi:hypothetical protein
MLAGWIISNLQIIAQNRFVITAASVSRTIMFGTNLSCKNDHILFYGTSFSPCKICVSACSHMGHGINEHRMPVKSLKSPFQFCRWKNILFNVNKEDLTWW